MKWLSDRGREVLGRCRTLEIPALTPRIAALLPEPQLDATCDAVKRETVLP
jgi:hypothetical protein